MWKLWNGKQKDLEYVKTDCILYRWIFRCIFTPHKRSKCIFEQQVPLLAFLNDEFKSTKWIFSLKFLLWSERHPLFHSKVKPSKTETSLEHEFSERHEHRTYRMLNGEHLDLSLVEFAIFRKSSKTRVSEKNSQEFSLDLTLKIPILQTSLESGFY